MFYSSLLIFHKRLLGLFLCNTNDTFKHLFEDGKTSLCKYLNKKNAIESLSLKYERRGRLVAFCKLRRRLLHYVNEERKIKQWLNKIKVCIFFHLGKLSLLNSYILLSSCTIMLISMFHPKR